MRKKRMWIGAFCCSGLLALGLTGCGVKTEAAETGSRKAVESTAPEESAPAEETSAGAVAEKFAETEAAKDSSAETASEDVFPADRDIEKIWGPVLEVEKDRITIDNQGEAAGKGEVVIMIDPENMANLLDAVDGFPVQSEDIKKGEVIYAYIGPAMMMSLPPIVNSELIVCQVPQDTAAPEYVHVKAMEKQEDGGYLLTSTAGDEYHIPEDCNIIPFLTRNLVRLTDVEEGSRCLLWPGEQGGVEKIVLFAGQN